MLGTTIHWVEMSFMDINFLAKINQVITQIRGNHFDMPVELAVIRVIF